MSRLRQRGLRKRSILLAGLALFAAAGPADAKTVLFVGNSFTYGELSPVMHYRTSSVTDLNGNGMGGVPALFKAFAAQAGLDYDVSLETVPASGWITTMPTSARCSTANGTKSCCRVSARWTRHILVIRHC